MRRRDRVILRAAIPAFALRVALGVAAAAGALLVPVAGWQVAAVVLGALAALRPATRLSYLVVPIIAVGLFITGPDAGRTALALLLVHAIHALTSVTALLGADALISLRALRPLALRFAVIQLGAQAFAAALLLMPAGGVAWLAPVGALALAGVAAVFLVVPRGRA